MAKAKTVKKPIKKASKKSSTPQRKSPKEIVEPGYKFSNQTRKRMSKAKKGRKLSQATKDKIREARREREALIGMGFIKPFKHSEETKKHLSQVMKKKKHRPSRKAILKSAEERSALKRLKKLSNKIASGKV